MKTKKENSKCLPKNDDGTDLRRLPLWCQWQPNFWWCDLLGEDYSRLECNIVINREDLPPSEMTYLIYELPLNYLLTDVSIAFWWSVFTLVAKHLPHCLGLTKCNWHQRLVLSWCILHQLQTHHLHIKGSFNEKNKSKCWPLWKSFFCHRFSAILGHRHLDPYLDLIQGIKN